MGRSLPPPSIRVHRPPGPPGPPGPLSRPQARQLGLAALGGLAVLALRSRGWPVPLPGCPLRALTGIPCPSCFLTRSVLATFHGDLGEALELHLFGPPLVVGGLAVALGQGVLGRPLPPWPWQRIGLGIALVLVAYWLVRLAVGGFPGAVP